MTIFEDLSPYTYFPDVHPGADVRNVGWLGAGVDFPRREPEPHFAAALHELVRHAAVCRTRGFHSCGLCPAPADRRDLSALARGSAEVHVTGADGVVYAAPELVHHYVTEHHYAPPAEFVAAVLATSRQGQAAWARVKAVLPVGAAVRGSSDSYHVHRGLFVRLDGFPGVEAVVAFQEFGVDSAEELAHEFGSVLEFVVAGHDDERREVRLRLPTA